MELCLRTTRHALQTHALRVWQSPDCCARHNCVSIIHPFLGKICAHLAAWSESEIWAVPRRNNPITSESLQRPETTRTEKARHQDAGCKLMHRKLCDEFSFLGKLAARRSPLPPSSRPAPSSVLLAQAARLLGRFTFGTLQNPGPTGAHCPLGGPGLRSNHSSGRSGDRGSSCEPSAPPSNLAPPPALAPPHF